MLGGEAPAQEATAQLLGGRKKRAMHERTPSDIQRALGLWAVLLIVGSAIGLSLPPSEKLHGPYRYVSSSMGWTYFLAWSASFYPQVYINWKRKTTVGLSCDFQLYNLLGFTCYTAFTCAFFYSSAVQDAYSRRHDGKPNKVEPNDVAFAVHALVLTVLTVSQVVYYDAWIGRQRPSRTAALATAVIVGAAVLYAIVVASAGGASGDGGGGGVLTWLDFLYYLSYVKIGVTLVKYIPQVLLNHRRRSTVGWSEWNVILDLTGGSLSLLQLLGDCANTGDWSGIRGYPAKFALGFVSIAFDLIFLTQHYVLWRGDRGDGKGGGSVNGDPAGGGGGSGAASGSRGYRGLPPEADDDSEIA